MATKEKIIVYFDGTYLPYNDINIGLLAQSLNFGTALIDSIRLYKNDGTGCFVGLNKYLSRFIDSAHESFYKEFNFTEKKLINILLKLYLLNKEILDYPYFRLLLFFNDDTLNIYNKNFHFTIIPMNLFIPSKFLSVRFSTFKRKKDKIHLKKFSSNYGPNLIDYYKAREEGYDNVLFIDEDDNIIEGLSENIFAYKNGFILTPPVENILNGVNRQLVINYLQKKGYKVYEENIKKRSILNVDSMFFVGTATGYRFINNIQGNNIPVSNNLLKDISDLYTKFIFTDNGIGDIDFFRFKI